MNQIQDLSVPLEWDNVCKELDDGSVSAASHEEAVKVLELWQTDDQETDVVDMMEVDEEVDINLLDEDEFFDPCMNPSSTMNLLDDDKFYDACKSPTSTLDDFSLVSMKDDDLDRFALIFLEDQADRNPIKPLEEQYHETLAKLAESMRRSQQTRRSLSIKTCKTEKYMRNSSVTGVLASIEVSSYQLQSYLTQIRQR
jgi:hypothetical protein